MGVVTCPRTQHNVPGQEKKTWTVSSRVQRDKHEAKATSFPGPFPWLGGGGKALGTRLRQRRFYIKSLKTVVPVFDDRFVLFSSCVCLPLYWQSKDI